VPRNIRHSVLIKAAAADSGFIGSQVPRAVQPVPGISQAVIWAVDIRSRNARQAVSMRSNHTNSSGFGLRGSMAGETFCMVARMEPQSLGNYNLAPGPNNSLLPDVRCVGCRTTRRLILGSFAISASHCGQSSRVSWIPAASRKDDELTSTRSQHRIPACSL
jgi:hypothetical protein